MQPINCISILGPPGHSQVTHSPHRTTLGGHVRTSEQRLLSSVGPLGRWRDSRGDAICHLCRGCIAVFDDARYMVWPPRCNFVAIRPLPSSPWLHLGVLATGDSGRAGRARDTTSGPRCAWPIRMPPSHRARRIARAAQRLGDLALAVGQGSDVSIDGPLSRHTACAG